MKKLFLLIVSVLAMSMYAEKIEDYRKVADIDYVGDNHTGHKMDVYYPLGGGEDQIFPVAIHIYGSAWMMNNMKSSADLNTAGLGILKANYVLVVPNHRSYNDAKYPAQIQDIKAVVRYLRANAEELRIDTSFIAISGFSSGGQLAGMMGVTGGETLYKYGGTVSMDLEGNLGKYTNESSRVDAVCIWSGMVDQRNKGCAGNPMSMSPEDDLVGGCNAQQCPDKHAMIACNTFITEDDAPTLIIHGSADNIVPLCEAKMYYDDLQRGGVESKMITHTQGHTVVDDLTGDMMEFFNLIQEKKKASVGVENVRVKSDVKKVVENGVIYILRDGKRYNVLGSLVPEL